MSKLPELKPNHHVWIVGAAYEHFAEKIREYELEIIRHSEFRKDANHNPKSIAGDKGRQEEITRLNQFIEQYRTICEWLKITHRDVSEKAAEGSAEGIADFLRQRHGLPKKKATKKTK
jgi:hypothetical protein